MAVGGLLEDLGQHGFAHGKGLLPDHRVDTAAVEGADRTGQYRTGDADHDDHHDELDQRSRPATLASVTKPRPAHVSWTGCGQPRFQPRA
jgi:hypothetical protein